ncbi:MAG: DUF5312 family protein [Treponema sp.]|jgi:hypothetical protein|nr:DUF5312 family protein [Treponema sp.]
MAEDLMDKVFSFFSGDGSMTDEKQNMLKQTAKELGQSKYSRFFKLRSEEVDPSFSSFLFFVYKTIYPLKVFMQDQKKMAMLRHMVVEACIDEKILETVNRLSTAALDTQAKTTSGEDLIGAIQKDVEKLKNQFDIGQTTIVDNQYEMVSAIEQLVSYNFSGFFKKFDSHFVDGSFAIEPKFPAIKVILIVDQIGDFLTVSQALKPEDDWVDFLNVVKKIDGREIAMPDQFCQMISMLREIHTSKILELMVQYTVRNPVWQWKHLNLHEAIGESWLSAKIAEANAYILKINTAKKNSQINALTKEIFESADLVRLENYTVHLSEPYRRKNVDYFLYAEGLNYLKAFLDDYVEKEIKELCDILLIRGQWTNNTMAREMSEAMHALQESQKPILDLDTVMSEDGADGGRLRASLLRIDRDSTQARTINSIISKVNDDAKDIITDAAQSLIVVGKHLKNLIDDKQKKHPELMVNWKELDLASKEPIVQRMVGNFKRINYFIQLMHLCTM